MKKSQNFGKVCYVQEESFNGKFNEKRVKYPIY